MNFKVGDCVILPEFGWGFVVKLCGMKTGVRWMSHGGRIGGADTRKLRLMQNI